MGRDPPIQPKEAARLRRIGFRHIFPKKGATHVALIHVTGRVPLGPSGPGQGHAGLPGIRAQRTATRSNP